MADGPWEKFQSAQPAGKPWDKFSAPADGRPWEKFDKPDEIKAAEPDAFDPGPMDWGGWMKKHAGEGVESIKKGYEQSHDTSSTMNRLLAVPKMVGGALGVAVSPFTGLQSAVGSAVEKGTGGLLTRENVDTAMMGIKAAPGALRMPALPKGTLIEKIFSPTTVSPEAGAAEASIRSAGGRAARDTATTAAEMEPFHRAVNAAPEADHLAFIDHVEGGPSKPTAELAPLADKLKAAYELRRKKLEALPSTAQAQFIDEYYPHHWQDPKGANQFAQNFGRRGSGKQGSSASLHARTIPTIADGIKAGLKPVTTDPIETTMRYVASMDKFIASVEVLDTAKAAGTVKYFRPKSMGASGHPGTGHNVAASGPIPDGWVKIEGRGSTNALGQQAYAPADWARVYNNFISRGFHANEEAGRVYDAVQSASNAVTSLELGLSGYHAFTMAKESIISDFAKGVSQLAGMQPIKAAKSMAGSPLAFISKARLGKKFEQVYLGRSAATPDFRKIVDLWTDAGGRAVGKGHDPTYKYSRMGSFFTAWKRGALRQEMADAAARVGSRPSIAGKGMQIGKETFSAIGRAMDTVAAPLFEKYIPRLKNGAGYDLLNEWVQANPKATYDQQVAMARKIVDIIDERFGEMIQDNIFWNKAVKQSAQLGMRSYSWTYGTVKQIGGGVAGLVRNPSSLSIKSPNYDPRTAYVVAMPIVTTLVTMVYHKLKTGKNPGDDPPDIRDTAFPQTGGTAPGFGGRGSVPERAKTPGYEGDVWGWFNDPSREALNKIASAPRMVWETLNNKDYAGHTIADMNDPLYKRMAEYMNHAVQSMGPISIKNIWTGNPTGSNISRLEGIAGIRPAPGYIQDPEGTERGMKAINRRNENVRVRAEKRQERKHGGPTNAD
jgi:hypothetical protein